MMLVFYTPLAIVDLAPPVYATNDPALADALAQQLATQNATMALPFRFVEVRRSLQATLGVVYIGRVDTASGQLLPGRSDLWGLAFEQGQWQIYRPGDPHYGAFLLQLEQLANPPIDAEFVTGPVLMPRVGSTAVNLLTPYQLPWTANAWATVTRSYNLHGVGQIDFALDANNQAITAAKDGLIIYANDSHSLNTLASGAWWYWNTVVIQHDPQEFSMAAHLLPNSVPAWIKAQCSINYGTPNCAVPIRAGQLIGIQGNTGTSSGAHLHFATGQSFVNDARADTLDEDGDGNSSELIHTGYAWALQNVGFAGYSDNVVANWPVGTRLKATWPTSAPTATSTPTATSSATQTPPPSATLTPTSTPTPTEPATASSTPTATAISSVTPTPDAQTATVTPTTEQQAVATTLVATATPLSTVTATPSPTVTVDSLLLVTPTPSPSPTDTWTPTPLPTAIELPTVTPTSSPSPTDIWAPTPLPTAIPSSTSTPTPTLIPTATPTLIPTVPPVIWPTVPAAINSAQPQIFLPLVQISHE